MGVRLLETGLFEAGRLENRCPYKLVTLCKRAPV
jgi:hypothetical protein